jgi:hypothetical protein
MAPDVRDFLQVATEENAMCRWIWSKEREGTAKLTERQSPERHRQRERER